MNPRNRHSALPFALATLLLVGIGCEGCEPSNNGTADDAGLDGGTSGDAGDDAPEGYTVPFEIEGWGLHAAARDASDIYVAGGVPDRGSLMHWDGEGWAAEEIPEGTPLLNWVMLLEGETIVVGNGGTVLSRTGNAWETQEVPTEEDLWGVWASSADDVWAVGGRGRADGQATLLRRVGGTWATVEAPELERPGVNAWFKVWGSSSDDVWIVGQRGGVLHWDGAALEEVGLGTSEDLISLHGTGADDVLIVGGRSNGVVSHFDGSEWATGNIAPAPGVNGVWMTGPGEFWLAGVRGLLRSGTVEGDGVQIPRTPPVSMVDIHAVTVVPGYGLLAVGGNFDRPNGPYEGVVLKGEEGAE